MTDAVDTAAELFRREGGRNRFTARTATVTAIAEVGEFIRVTLTGPEFVDFVSGGPADHVRVFFPDPETGELVAPAPAGPGEDGIVRPDRPMFSRDFTPLHIREIEGSRSIDLDILRHEAPGPAARWAAAASVGDTLVIVGPRGSRGATLHAPRVLLVVDGTALPSAGRWIADLPDTCDVEVVADVTGDLEWVRTYLRGEGGRDVPVLAAGDDLAETVRTRRIDAGTFVFAAAEASRLVPVRRYLRHELGLPRAQYAVSGYWKRGTAGFDHHAPIDPEDPED
ncbi:siderophore-interacting protein [Microbacterium sp. GXF7504]